MDKLFSPVSLGSCVLHNRFAVAPMTRASAAPDGVPTPAMTSYYGRFARGHFALVITEGTYVDEAFSQGYVNQPGIATPAHASGWASIVREIHAAGAKAFIQLMHAGALSQYNRYQDASVAPSSLRPKGEQMALYRGRGPYRIPRALTSSEIDQIQHAFATAAQRAVDAGFDGIEIHGANGYLIDQFLTDYSNVRDDEYGGSTENRVRFAAEVVERVKTLIGSAVPVGVRLSQGKVNDYTHKWAGGETDAKTIFGAVAEAGADFIHVTSFEAWQPAFGESRSLPDLAREFSKLPVIANGSLHDPVMARQLVDRGTSLISLGRGALANPDLPARVRRRDPLDAFDAALLQPTATIENEERWRKGRAERLETSKNV